MSQDPHELPSTLEEETEPPLEGVIPEGDMTAGGVTLKIAQDAYDLDDPPEDLEQRRMFSIRLIEDLRVIERDLLEREDVVDVVLRMEEPAPEFTITTIENGLGRELPRDIKSFYRVLNGFELSWSFVDELGLKQPGGHIQIFDIARVFGFWFDTLWVHDPNRTEEELDFLWSLRGLDGGGQAGETMLPDSPMTVLHLLGDWGSDYELMLFHGPDHLSLMQMDLMSYVYYALETRGLGLWRQVVSAMDLSHPRYAELEQGRVFFERLARFFPDVDLEEYMALVPSFSA